MRNLKSFIKIAIPTLLIVAFTSFFFIFSSRAASLGGVYAFFNRIQAGLDGTGANAVQFVLALEPKSTFASGGTITIDFPDGGDTQWCRASGALTVAGAATSQANLSGTEWNIDNALPASGTLAATCAQGSGAGSADKITITNVGALTANSTYGVSLQSQTGRIGTASAAGQHEITVTVTQGATMDSKTFKISLITNDQVVITATVTEAPSVNCSISTNVIGLGTLYPGGAYAIGSHTISTSATSGYYWAAYGTGDGGTDAGLWKSLPTTKLLQSGPNATINLAAAGAEGFGMTLSDPDGAGGAVVSSNFVDSTPGTFGTLDRAYAGVKLLLSQNGVQSSAENSTVTYGASAGTSAPAGSYQETVTFICGGYY